MKRVVAIASLVSTSSLVALIIIEIVLRVADYNYPLRSTYDPYTGYGTGADMRGWANTESVELVRSDRFGLRTFGDSKRALAHALTMKKPEGVMRVAFLGDSFTQSMHVAYMESFPYQVEQNLNACPNIGRRVEVLNFAISGFSNVQELMAFRHRARNFEPDIVVLVFDPSNDFRNNYKKLERYPFAPYAEFRDGKLRLDLSFQSDPAFVKKMMWSNVRNEIANRSYLLQFISARIGRMVLLRWHRQRVEAWQQMKQRTRETASRQPNRKIIGATSEKPVQTPPDPDIPQENGKELDKYFAADYLPTGIAQNTEHFAPKNAFVEMLWKLAESVVLQLKTDVEKSGAQFWMTSVVLGMAIDPDADARRDYMTSHGLPSLDYAVERLRNLADRHGFSFVSLLAPLREYAEQTGRDLQYFKARDVRGHWNRYAHSVIGKTIANAICQAQVR